MKITALEIRKKTFEKNFRGYDKDEVDVFLKELSEEWEKLVAENEELQVKLEQSNREANKLKEVEASLFRTLKTAEDTGASIIEEANDAAEHIEREAQQNAQVMLNDAQTQSQNLIEFTEQKRAQIISDLKIDVSELVNGYEKLVDQRELILNNLKKLAEDIEDKITISNSDIKNVNIKAHLEMIEKLNNSDSFTISNISSLEEDKMEVFTLEENTSEEEIDIAELEIGSQEINLEINTEEELEEEVENTPFINTSVQDNEAESKEETDAQEPEENKNKGNSFFDDID